uniref:Uncharacterized protein n=1 Tax=Lygus hesperus TaxID=30085 RepID=A0A0A9WRX1_LYGHE
MYRQMPQLQLCTHQCNFKIPTGIAQSHSHLRCLVNDDSNSSKCRNKNKNSCVSSRSKKCSNIIQMMSFGRRSRLLTRCPCHSIVQQQIALQEALQSRNDKNSVNVKSR